MSRLFLLCLLVLTPLLAAEPAALAPKERDRQAILAMAGTYVVDFHFEETVGFPIGYDLKPAYDSGALEIVLVLEDSADKIVLQHVLQTDHGIVKHWRQDWLYENRELLEYQGHDTWAKRTLPETAVHGTWTQRVFQVDDSPRYEGFGKWLHIGDLSQWESEPTNRPLPRREYTKRSDYDIMVARNRQTLTQTGWVHEQDNYKLKLGETAEENQVIARELGLNSYERTLPTRCAEATAWWEEHKAYWADVRAVWAEVYQNHDQLTFAKQIDDKALYRHLFKLDRELAGKRGYRSGETRKQVRALIDQFLNPPAEETTASY